MKNTTPSTTPPGRQPFVSSSPPFWQMILAPVLLTLAAPAIVNGMLGARGAMERFVARGTLQLLDGRMRVAMATLTPAERRTLNCDATYSENEGDEGVVRVGARTLLRAPLPSGTDTLDCPNGALTLQLFIVGQQETMQVLPSGEIVSFPVPERAAGHTAKVWN